MSINPGKTNSTIIHAGDCNETKIFVMKGLNDRIERFFIRILDEFINNWYTKISRSNEFVISLKSELAHVLQKLVLRYSNLKYDTVISTKLLPVVYQHFTQVEHAMKKCKYDNGEQEEVLKTFFQNHSQNLHPAVKSRKSEIEYLRTLCDLLLENLLSTSSSECKPIFILLRELFTNWIFLQITDAIANPNIINQLVILACTSTKSTINELKETNCVELLENFTKSPVSDLKDGKQKQKNVDGNFFKDQIKLYNFMQHLKSKSAKDVEILKFVLDVEDLNSKLGKTEIISDPIKLSNLQQVSEKLLQSYLNGLYDASENGKEDETKKPNDLNESYEQAKMYLEHKWTNNFYKSAEYYKYIYGDRTIFNTTSASSYDEKDDILSSGESISNQKLAAKIRNAMLTKVTVGIEETDRIWEAMDASAATPSSPNHYYNSMAVKLRKERGQDLEKFMYSLFESIEQEADLGEDIVEMQIRNERQHDKIKYGNIELYENLFNIPFTSTQNDLHIESSPLTIKTPSQSILYFFTKIINIHDIILRIISFFINYLPDSDAIICAIIRKIANKLINQAILAHLLKELEEKIFEPKVMTSTKEELEEKLNLAAGGLEKIKKGLSKNLFYLQNPILNKLLVYSLLDVIITEGFNELRHVS
jgi:hypothetical protein